MRKWLWLLVLLLPVSALAQSPPACTHYASPGGTGSTCTIGTPCLVSTWTASAALAQAGNTLCLNNGTYLRSAGGNIDPPDTVAGAAGTPITVRALNDGQVTIDAQGGFAVFLNDGNDYWHIWGLNAHTGGEAIYRLKGSGIRVYRSIGWNGTSGSPNSYGFSIGGDAVDTIVEDCAAWGSNMRKIFDGGQTTAAGENTGFSGFRRCWGEWSDHPAGASCPNNTYQVGYRSRQQRLENVLGTARLTGTACDFEGVMGMTYDCADANISTNTEVLGSFFYFLNGTTFPTPGATAGVMSHCISDTDYRDVGVFLDTTFTTIRPFRFANLTSTAQEAGNVCTNCLSVHAGTPTLNQAGSGWSLVNFHEGNGLSAATGGTSAFTLLPGLCTRYEAGVLTATALWPWPMNQRILDARTASGAPAVDVTATMETILGTIPTACGGAGGDVTAPAVAFTAPAADAVVSGITTVTATATDAVGVVGVQFRIDGAQLQAEDTSSPYTLAWNTALATNGVHTLTATGRDAAGNSTVASRTVTVANGDTVPPDVALTAPLSGSVVSGLVALMATATDNIGVVGVTFLVDGVPLIDDLTAAYSVMLDTRLGTNGEHTITAVARDAVPNTSSTSATITVENPSSDRQYPSYRYHPTLAPVIAADSTADVALIAADPAWRPEPYPPGATIVTWPCVGQVSTSGGVSTMSSTCTSPPQ